MNPPTFERPAMDEAIETWKKILAERNFPTDLVWLFEENLCFEKSPSAQGGLQITFQTQFTPPPEDAFEMAYDHFVGTDARMVFYRLGNCRGKSICVLLCDSWFDQKTDSESESYLPRDEWKISFRPGLDDEIEEITDLRRWRRRIRHQRAFHDLDFCMSLAAIEEIRIYGRPLLPYERFADTMLTRLRRLMGQNS